MLTAQALLFDMDGTLVDSEGPVRRIWATFAQRFGLDVDEIQQTSHGVKMIETILRWAPEGVDARAVERELQAIELDDLDGIVPVAGARDFLGSLPADAWALVTSATAPLAEMRMRVSDLPLPSVVVTAELVTAGKPEPDCYLLAAERLGVSARDTIVFEDAPAGIRAGLAAGARVVVVGDVAGFEDLPRIADYRGVRASSVSGVLRVTFAGENAGTIEG